MKSWVFAAFLISGCALVACGDDNSNPPSTGSTASGSGSGSGGSGASGGSGGNGGEGGNGGSGGDGGASTTSSSSTGTPTPTCDDETDTCGSDTNTGCYKCAAEGACSDVLDNCRGRNGDGGNGGGPTPCIALASCMDGCSKEEDPATCVEECRTANEAGVEAYDAVTKCIVCEQCANNCGASEEPLCAM
ncbi:hypothetical protein WME75_37290 [Sorangium sp. So ce1014]|uniref:hypothetical protein n=1 Tax=Sorangium sp. So ce1014 TaxID=3133326 RepID=UPI003F5F03A8